MTLVCVGDGLGGGHSAERLGQHYCAACGNPLCFVHTYLEIKEGGGWACWECAQSQMDAYRKGRTE